jgi:nitrogen regulatory protein P-II 1
MRLIIAYIQPDKLNDVKQALNEAGICNMSVTNALGCGNQGGFTESYRGVEREINLLKKVRIEIALDAEKVETGIEAIIKGARTGQIGDGKIFVTELVEAVRIRTGDRGGQAI